MNPLRVLLKDKVDGLHKLKIMQHEFRPAQKLKNSAVKASSAPETQQPVLRGAVRILQGFKPEVNSNPHVELAREQEKPRTKSRKKKPSKSNSRRKSRGAAATAAAVPGEEESEDDGPTRAEVLALAKALDRSKAVIHEARTRVTVAAWNPNIEYGWWAAVAMGSGLVKVMDLGIGD